MKFSENVIFEYFEEKGYEVIKLDPRKEKGIPDFKIFNFKTGERFYVEVKMNDLSLSIDQKKKIASLMKDGNKVLLARFNTKKKEIAIYELDPNWGQKYLYSIKADKIKQEAYHHHCKRCNYDWSGDLEKPGVCPRCKSYSWDKPRIRKRKTMWDKDKEVKK